MWRRFKSVSRAGHMLYWDCPEKCGMLHKIELSMDLPITYSCSCGLSYDILRITNLTMGNARLLLEVINENKGI